MKKHLLYLFTTLAFIAGMFVQTANADIGVTVTNNTNTTPNLATTYTSLALALADLNAVTAMTGPVTLTLTAGTSETAPPAGLTIGSTTLNAVLSVINTVTIVKAGGTVTLNAGIGTATPGSAAPDGILKIVGADYITIDGLTFTDGNAANPATMEFGIALFKLSASDGAQNNTIMNCTFNMQRINNAAGTAPMVDGAVGILVINSTPTAATTALTPTAAVGTNSYNKFYTNIINSGNIGIALSGYAAATPFTLGDTGNDIGGTSTGQGNTILNYGGAAAATNPAAGIRANNQWGVNISYNTINNNNGSGVNHVSTLRGIYAQAGTSASATINYNQITIHGGAITSQVAAIENAIGSTAASNTIYVNHNTISGDYLTATTGVFYGIYNTSTATTVNITYNSLSSMSYSDAALTGSGVMYPIFSSGAAVNILADHNTIDGISRTGTTGANLIGIYFSSGTNQTVTNNSITNMSINGTGTAGALYGIQTSTGTIVVSNNNVNNLNNTKTTGTGVLYGIYNIASPTNENVNSNTVHDLTNSGTGITYGIYHYTTTGTRTMSFNTVYAVTGAGTTVAGMASTSSSPNIFKNKIYNISSTSSGNAVVSGLILGSLGTSGIANVYNNIIGDIKSPYGTIATIQTPAIRGINITTTTTTTTLNVHYNTVYLNAASSATNFGTAGLYVTSSATATTAALNLRNNIIVNNSTPAGTGYSVAFHRSSVDLANYGSLSNNNLFYAGTPGAANLIMFDGTNSYQTLAAFKTAVGPTRDAVSISENPAFVSTIGSNATFLHINTEISTGIESGAANIATYTDDYDGDIRQGNAGYPGAGTAPDIGADEFEGVPSYTCTTPNPGNTISTANNLCLGQNITLSLQNAIVGTGNTYQWQSSANGTSYGDISGANASTYTLTPAASLYYQCIVTCQNGPVSVTSTPIQITFVYNILSTTPGTRCGTGTVNLAATGSGGTLGWYATSTGGATLGTGSPFTTPTISSTTTFYVGAENIFPGNATVGAGASTSNTYSNPFYSLWSNIHTQHLIPAAELYAAGLSAGNITSVALNVTDAGTLPMIDLSLKIGATTATNMSAFLSPVFTVVYTNASYMPTAGINVLTFSTPFNWDGISNIVLEFCHGNGSSSATMNRTVKADATSYVSSIKTHVSAATPAATICANVTSNLLTYSIRPQFTFAGQTSCSSLRSAVIATVTPPPALTVSANQTICNNTVATISVTSNIPDFNSYVWSPVTALFTNNLCTTPYTGSSVTTVYFKSTAAGVYTYTCTANNSTTLCANTAASVVTNLPASPVITATPANHCLTGSSQLTTVPATGYGTATFQWQNSPDNITFTDIPDENSLSYSTPVLTSTTYYKLQIKLGVSVCTESNVATVTVNNPQITGTTPGTRCGIGTVNLGATGTGGTLNWYANATGGSPVGTGNSFTTPVISTTTTYYVSESAGGLSGLTIPGDGDWDHVTSTGAFQTTLITSAYMILTVLQPITLSTMDIYPSATLGTSFNIEARTGSASGTTFATYFGTTTVVNSGTPTVAQTVPVNWSLPIGTYYIGFVGTNPSTWRSGSFTHSFPWTLTNYVSMDFYLTPSYQYFFYNLTLATGCTSPRTSVIATVVPAPDLTLSADQTVCSDEVATISVTSTLSDFNTYTWSPVTNLFTDVACTIPYVALASATTVYAKSTAAVMTTYTCTATKISSGCVNMAQTVIIVLHPSSSISAVPTAICVSGSAVLSLSPATGWGAATFQWQDSPDNITFTDIPGALSQNYTTPAITSTTYYKLKIKNGAGIVCAEPQYTLEVKDPQVTGTTPGSRCGTGTVELGATGTGGTLNWYANLTGGTSLGTGPSFTTPVISSTTSYYVGVTTPGTTEDYVGMASSVNGTSGSGTTTYGLYFDALAAFTLKSVVVYPNATANNTPGTVTISVINGSGTVLNQTTVNVIGYIQSTTPTAETVNLDFNILPGNALRLVMTSKSSGISGLMFQPTAGGPYPYPYTIPGVVSITSGTYSGAVYPSLYYYFYHWLVSVGCASPRTEVVATVVPPPDLTLSANQTICSNGVATIAVTSLLSDFDTYTWSPVTNLFTDFACTTPYVALFNATTVYAKSAAAVITTYTCTATKISTGCVNLAQIVITVLPPIPTISAQPVAICVSGSAVLSLSPATGWGTATFQWQDSPDNITFTDISGATTQSYTTPTLTSTRYYKLKIKNGAGIVCTEPQYTLEVNDPQLTGTTPGSRCGIGTVELGASGTGGTLNWYANSTGGTSLGTGPLFTTPVISSTTSFYVEVTAVGGTSGTVPSPTVGTSSFWTSAVGWGLRFTVNSFVTINSVKMYPSNSSAGAATLQVKVTDLTDVVLYSGPVYNFTVGTTPSEKIVPVGISVPPGNYKMVMSSTGINNLIRESSGVTFPYTSSGNEVSITAGANGAGSAQTTSSYYWFYSWNISTGCASPRTEVIATVTPPPAITPTASPTAICEGESSTLNVTSPNPNYTYIWTPGSLPGATQIVSPVVTTEYTVTATDAGTGCVNLGSVTVTVNSLPSAITITPSAPVIAPGDIQILTASGGKTPASGNTGWGGWFRTFGTPYTGYYGGTKTQNLYLASELTAMGLTAGVEITSLSFTIYTFTGPYTFNNFTIAMKNTASTVLTSTLETGTTTVLAPSSFTLSGIAPFIITHTFTSPFTWNGSSNLLIETCYNNNDAGGILENSAGVICAQLTSNLSAYYTSDNNPTVCSSPGTASLTLYRLDIFLGFNYPASITWSPITDLYTNAGATTPYTTGTVATTVWAKPPATTTYTATSTSPAGCTGSQNVTVTVIPNTKTLNLKLYLEGLCDPGFTGLMRQACESNVPPPLGTPHFGAGIADQVTVELHNALTPYGIAYTYSNVNLNTNGTLSITTIPGTITGSYYVVIKHRNSIETWSSAPVAFGGAGPISYDFTTALTQAYHDANPAPSMKLVGSLYAFWGGDVFKDPTFEYVDASDLSAVDNANTAILVGYNPEDVNGDGIVDASDLALVDNNNTAQIHVQKP